MPRKPIIASAVASLVVAAFRLVKASVVASSQMLTQLTNRIRNTRTPKLSVEIRQKSYIKGWLSKILLEDWRGELEALRYGWLKEGKPEVQIKILTCFCLLGLLKAYLQIKVENIWLPKKKQS